MPRLSYNLLSVLVATEHRKSVSFEKAGCQVLDKGKPVAVDNQGRIDFASKIIGIIGIQKQQAKCWHNRSNFKQIHFTSYNNYTKAEI